MGTSLHAIVSDMSKKILGISWLNGRFDAAALEGGAVSGSWLCPAAVNAEVALGIAPAETVLLAIDLGGALHLLLGKGDGTVFFSRTLLTGDAIGSERLLQEINRTLHFAQQQFAAKVTQMFVSGASAFSVLKDLPIGNGLKVQPAPLPKEPVDYAWCAGTLSPRLSLNLISSSGRIKQGRQRLAAI